MRSIIVILILGVVGLIAAIHFGLVDVSQSRPAALPSVQTENGKVSARGGQAPAFDVATGSVGVTRKEATVGVPKVTIEADPKNISVPTVEITKAKPDEESPAAH